MMMARFRSGSAMRPIHRIKHIIDQAQTQTAGITGTFTLVDAVENPAIANTDEVQIGSKVNAIYLTVEVAPTETDAGAIPQVYLAVFKNPSSLITTLNPSTLGDDDNKKFVIHQEMVMVNNLAGGNPRNLFKGVIVIPKGMRRFGIKDTLQVAIRPTAVNMATCIQCIYKEFQ